MHQRIIGDEAIESELYDALIQSGELGEGNDIARRSARRFRDRRLLTSQRKQFRLTDESSRCGRGATVAAACLDLVRCAAGRTRQPPREPMTEAPDPDSAAAAFLLCSYTDGSGHIA